MNPSTTASAGAMLWTMKSDVASPIAVERPLITQNSTVISGTRRAPAVVSQVRSQPPVPGSTG